MVGIFSNILFEVQVQPNNLFGIKNKSNGYNISNVNKRDIWNMFLLLRV